MFPFTLSTPYSNTNKEITRKRHKCWEWCYLRDLGCWVRDHNFLLCQSICFISIWMQLSLKVYLWRRNKNCFYWWSNCNNQRRKICSVHYLFSWWEICYWRKSIESWDSCWRQLFSPNNYNTHIIVNIYIIKENFSEE